MVRRFLLLSLALVVSFTFSAGSLQADVFNMGGTRNPDGSWNGVASLETVPVGNLGNANDSTGYGSVGYAYNIGKYEVTAGQYTAFLNAVAATDTYSLYNTNMWSSIYGCRIERTGSSGNYVYSVASDWANRPVSWVSWGDAARFSNWLHNGQPTGLQCLATTEDGAYYLNGVTSNALMAVTRKSDSRWFIPTEDEWYKAAYHKNDGVTGNYWDFPTSSDSAPGQDMADASSNNANIYVPPYTIPLDSGKYTTVVGEFQNSDSPYGTFDQGGNVWEWNEGVVGNSFRVLRGASFSEGNIVSYLLASHRTRETVAAEDYTMGFRVASSETVPEPSTLIVWSLLGGVSVAIGWWRRRRTD